MYHPLNNFQNTILFTEMLHINVKIVFYIDRCECHTGLFLLMLKK